MMIRTFVIIFLLVFGAPCLAGKGDFAKVKYPVSGEVREDMKQFDREFVRLLKKWHVPGGSVAIMQHDKIIFNRGYGWADLEKKIPVKPDSLFRIASVSKAITGVAILKLIEEGKLSFKDKVFDILHDLKPVNGRKFNRKQKKMTVKHLLNMASGWIPNGKAHFDPMFGPWSRDIKKILGKNNLPASCADVTRMMMTMPLRKRPGSGYAYSNLDYCVLGLIVSKVAGGEYDYRGYEKYVNNAILKPMQINDMHIGSTYQTKAHPNEVKYYRYRGHIDISYQGRSSYFPYGDDEMLKKNFSNGGWVASTADLVKFAHDVGNGKVLSEKSLKLMTTPPPYRDKKAKRYFGMGWRVKHVGKDKYWYQTGSFTGTNALVIRKPNGTAIAVAFNSRPPIYHLFREFRRKLHRLFRTAELDDIYELFAIVPDFVMPDNLA